MRASRNAPFLIAIVVVLVVSVRTFAAEPDAAQQAVIREIVRELVGSLFRTPDDEKLGKVASWSPDEIGPVSKESTPNLLEGLKARDFKVRGRSATALGLIGPDAAEAVPALQTALRDKSGAVKASAAGAIWSITGESETACPTLVRLLLGKVKAYHVYAANALGAVGPPAKIAVPQLVKSLQTDKYPGVRAAVALALLKIGSADDNVLAALERARSDNDETVREVSGKVLDALRSPRPKVQTPVTTVQSPPTEDPPVATPAKEKELALAGTVVYAASATEKQLGVEDGPAGTIALKISSERDRVEGDLTIKIVEKLFYADSETSYAADATFSGAGTEPSGGKRRFKAAGRFTLTARNGTTESETKGEVRVEFDLLPDKSVEGVVSGIGHWAEFRFTASVSRS